MRFATLAAAGLLLAACQGQQASGPPPSSQTVRAGDTAPADLQLICASRAAEQYSVAADQTLPTGSSVLGGGQYEVQLTLAGSAARCVINDNAEIVSLALVT